MIMKVFGGSWGLGAFLGLQIQWPALDVGGGFDSHISPPKSSPVRLPSIGGHFILPSKYPKIPNFIPPVTTSRHQESAEPKDKS